MLLTASGSIFWRIAALRDAVKPTGGSAGVTVVKGLGGMFVLETHSGPLDRLERACGWVG